MTHKVPDDGLGQLQSAVDSTLMVAEAELAVEMAGTRTLSLLVESEQQFKGKKKVT
eukprot:COSAG05_NODE_15791_length_361_cov_0.603053_1_plen_55_part_10